MTYTPDPELVGLLGELNEQPERTLLNLPSYDGYLREPISHRRAGLSSLEREILQAHREEAAYLLNYLAHVFAYEERTGFLGATTWIRADFELPQPTDVDFVMRRSALLGSAFELPKAARGVLLEGMEGRPSIRRAAQLSLEFEPSAYSSFQIASALLQTKESAKALVHARHAVENCTYSGHLDSALRALGMSLMLEGQSATALDSVFAWGIYTLGEPSPQMLLLALLCACRSGRPWELEEAAHRVSEVLDPEHPEVCRFRQLLSTPGTLQQTLSSECPPPKLSRAPSMEASDRVLEAISAARP